MDEASINAENNSAAAGNNLYNQCFFGDGASLEKYDITDLRSAIKSVLCELDNERKKLHDFIAKTGKVEAVTHLYIIAALFSFATMIVAVLNHEPISTMLVIGAAAVLFIVLMTFQLPPTRKAKFEERIQEKQVDILYKVLGRLQEEQIWEQISEKLADRA